MLCEEGMTTIEARSALSIPQSTKQAAQPKTQSNIRKIDKFYINCGMINHNVETCRKKYIIVAATKITQQNKKSQKTSSYAYHIYGLNGHKMTNSSKFIEMQKMFHGKFVTITKVQPVAET